MATEYDHWQGFTMTETLKQPAAGVCALRGLVYVKGKDGGNEETDRSEMTLSKLLRDSDVHHRLRCRDGLEPSTSGHER